MSILKRSWFSHFWINLATTGVLALSFGVIFGTFLISNNLSKLFTVWGEEIQITMYLQDSITLDQKNDLEAKLKNLDSVADFNFIDKNAAAQSFEKSLKNYGPHFLTTLKNDVGNPFPASFQVQLKPQFKNPEKVEEIAHGLQQIAGVEDISYGQEWVKNYTVIIKFARLLGIALSIVILVSCLFTVSNSIQASLSSRREEIEILELIGSTTAAIRKPFIIEGAFQGTLAATVSLGILGIIYTYSFHVLENIVGASSVVNVVSFLPAYTITVLLLFGMGVGALGSYLCIAKINTGWAAAEGNLT
jgi:cell division transport system permease protein